MIAQLLSRLHVFSIDAAHRAAGGAAVVGEIGAFWSGDRIQQIGWILAGAAVWLSHFLWDQRKQQLQAEADARRARDDAKESDRKNLVLDAVAKKMREAVEAGQPNPFPELSHLILSPDEEHEPHRRKHGATAPDAATEPEAQPTPTTTPSQ